jgi:hypothetical protein
MSHNPRQATDPGWFSTAQAQRWQAGLQRMRLLTDVHHISPPHAAPLSWVPHQVQQMLLLLLVVHQPVARV